MNHHPSFHEGEIAMQEIMAQRTIAERNAKSFSTVLTPSMAEFLAALPPLVVATPDEQGHPVATLFRPKALATSPDGSVVTLHLDDQQAEFFPLGLAANGALGGLAIDFSKRRRLRLNGRVLEYAAGVLRLEVQQAYANCPKHIVPWPLEASWANAALEGGDLLGTRERDWIKRSRTCFLATSHPEQGFDISHRGGEAGFVSIDGDGTITIPEYHGNSLFCSLGNLWLDFRMGLVFPDFAQGKQLQIWGHAEQSDFEKLPKQGFWRLKGTRWRILPMGYALSRDPQSS